MAKNILLLTPGAGADRTHSTLVAIDKSLPKKSWLVDRMDFPYRKQGRKVPDRQPILTKAINDEVAKLEKKNPRVSLFLGGRSLGGRICSIATAEGLDASGLVLISYPLHPPGKPDNLRTDHFPDLRVPCLFISGTRDAFGTPKELEKATKKIKGDVTHVWLEGGDHGLKKFDEVIVDEVSAWLAQYS